MYVSVGRSYNTTECFRWTSQMLKVSPFLWYANISCSAGLDRCPPLLTLWSLYLTKTLIMKKVTAMNKGHILEFYNIWRPLLRTIPDRGGCSAESGLHELVWEFVKCWIIYLTETDVRIQTYLIYQSCASPSGVWKQVRDEFMWGDLLAVLQKEWNYFNWACCLDQLPCTSVRDWNSKYPEPSTKKSDSTSVVLSRRLKFMTNKNMYSYMCRD